MPGNDSDSGTLKYAKGFIYFGILFLTLYTVINKDRVLNIDVSNEEIKRCKKTLIIYFIVDLIVMTMLFIIRGLRMGTLHW
jgi:hypothetical protein